MQEVSMFCNLHVSLPKDFWVPLIISCLLLLWREFWSPLNGVLWQANCICQWTLKRINQRRELATLVWWWQILRKFTQTVASASFSFSDPGLLLFLGCRVSGCNLDAAAHYVPQLPRLRHTNLPKVIYWQLRKVHFAIFQIAKARRQTHQLRPIRASLTSGLKLKLKLNCDWYWLAACLSDNSAKSCATRQGFPRPATLGSVL